MDWSTFWVVTAVGAIISVITGVATYWITRTRERLDESRRMQRELLTKVIANRYDLKGDAFSQALNGCAVVFSESVVVRNALKDFHAAVVAGSDGTRTQATLLKLIRAMIEHLGLDFGRLDDEFILRPFNTRRSSTSMS